MALIIGSVSTYICSVDLSDVSERPVEEILIFDLVLYVDYLAEGFLYLALSGFRVLPAREANKPNDPINVGDDPLHSQSSLASQSSPASSPSPTHPATPQTALQET
jgi:hypothetical protein